MLEDVHFAFDDDTILESEIEALGLTLQHLQSELHHRLEIEGHADERGSVEYNLALGARRAAAVKQHLIDAGISANRFTTISYGKELPICTDDTEECRKRNRRVHFVILGDGG